MCIGIPMRVIESRPGVALCEGEGQRANIDTALVGDQPDGTWLLVFLGTARETLSAQRAKQISDALAALRLAVDGGSADAIDMLFPDLANREPELPDFLKNKAEKAQERPDEGGERNVFTANAEPCE